MIRIFFIFRSSSDNNKILFIARCIYFYLYDICDFLSNINFNLGNSVIFLLLEFLR